MRASGSGSGKCPSGVDLADWVLSPMPEPDEDRVLELLPELTRAVEMWIDGGRGSGHEPLQSMTGTFQAASGRRSLHGSSIPQDGRTEEK